MDKNFEDLIAQAEAVDVTGWDFSRLKIATATSNTADLIDDYRCL
jgi:hypothetical protein